MSSPSSKFGRSLAHTPAIILNRVVLPAPFGPINPMVPLADFRLSRRPPGCHQSGAQYYQLKSFTTVSKTIFHNRPLR